MTQLIEFGHCTLDQDGCSTCGDVGVPVRVIQLTAENTALCEDRTGARAEVATAFALDCRPGDILPVHMGVAITHIYKSALSSG